MSAPQFPPRLRDNVQRYGIEQFFATRALGDAEWSPDGVHVAFVANISGRDNIWLVPSTGGWPTQLTISEQRQEEPTWSPDGRYLAFVSDNDANEQWDIFLVDVANGAVTNLTQTPDISEESPLWSPDSRSIACCVKRQDEANYEIALIDVETCALRRVTALGDPDVSLSPCAFVPDSRWLLCSREFASGKDGDAVLVHLDSGEIRVLTPHEGEEVWSPSDISPDGRWVLLTSNAKNGHDNVALLDLPAALADDVRRETTSHVRWITDDVWEMASGGFSPDGSYLTYEANRDGQGELYVYEVEADRSTRLDVGSGYCGFDGCSSSWSRGGRRLLYYRSAADSPGDAYVYDFLGGTSMRLTHSFVGGVNPADMVEPYAVHYDSRDDLSISGFLYVPWNAQPDGSHPAIVWVHGGPAAQSVNHFNRAVQYFVNQGYVVLTLNYRGSTGYGKAFMDANRFDMGGGDLADVVEGAHFLVRTGYVDATRIAVGGGSYGGYLTMCAVTKTPEVWAAGIAMFPFVNWFTELEHEDPLLRQYDLATMGDPADAEAAARYRDRSPIFFIDRITAPLMLVAGNNDPRCPADESQQVHDALAARGQACEFLLYGDEGHGFAKIENMFDAYRKIVGFLAAHV